MIQLNKKLEKKTEKQWEHVLYFMIDFNFVNHMHIVNSDVFFCSKKKEG